MILTKAELFSKVTEVLVDHFELEQSLIKPEARLLEDLDLDSIDGIDEGRLESALSAMAGTLDKVDDDPRQAVQAMRRLLEDSGLKMGRTMEEAVRRLEAGEDVEAVEADLSEVMEEDQLFAARPGNIFTAIRQRYLPPRIDPTLYELDSPS